MTYEQWDFIADAYIPILILINLGLMGHFFRSKYWLRLQQGIMSLITAIPLVYISMWLDQVFSLWPAFNSDFSTHTALAYALIWHWKDSNKRLAATGLISLLMYFILMDFQGYHTWLDMISTILAMTILFQLAHSLLSFAMDKKKPDAI